MDWAKTALGLRDHAISVFQDEGNAPQVRARAYLYADVMQHFVGEDHPRPKCLPSIEAYQRAMIALVINAYVRQGMIAGELSYDAEKFLGWVRAVQAGPSQELLQETLQTMGEHMWPFMESYEGTFIDNDTTHEINRSVALHAFAVLTALFVDAGIKHAEAPVLKLLETPPDQWETPENMAPLLERVTALFSAKRSESGEWMEFDPSPSIIGFAHLESEKAFIFDLDMEEADRIIDLDFDQMAHSQEQLFEGIKDATIAIKEGNYPFLRGRKLACYRVGKEGILPRAPASGHEESGERLVIDSDGLPELPEDFEEHSRAALDEIGLMDPALRDLRMKYDFALLQSNGRDVLIHMQSLGQSGLGLLQRLRYGDNPLTKIVAGSVFDNDDFFSGTVMNVFGCPPDVIYGESPLTRALEEGKFETACAIMTHIGDQYSAAEELGQSWVQYKNTLADQGLPYFTWQVMNTVMYEADAEKHAEALLTIQPDENPGTWVGYHQSIAKSFAEQGGPFVVARNFFS